MERAPMTGRPSCCLARPTYSSPLLALVLRCRLVLQIRLVFNYGEKLPSSCLELQFSFADAWILGMLAMPKHCNREPRYVVYKCENISYFQLVSVPVLFERRHLCEMWAARRFRSAPCNPPPRSEDTKATVDCHSQLGLHPLLNETRQWPSTEDYNKQVSTDSINNIHF